MMMLVLLMVCFYTDEWSELMQVQMNATKKTASTIVTVLPIRVPSPPETPIRFRVRREDGVILDQLTKDLLIEVLICERYLL